MDSQIAVRFQRFEAGKAQFSAQEQLVQLLLQRLKFTGSFEDFEVAERVSAAALKQFPRKAQAHRLRADYLSAVHRFDEALSVLQAAEKLGAKKGLALARGWIHLAQGRQVEGLLADAKGRAKGSLSVANWSFLAAVEAALGQFEAADAHFQKALDVNLDVSPFLICQLLFQRGVMWAEQADKPERALPLYREAVKRLPRYISAQVHLAELEVEAGDLKAGIARLRGIAAKTHDPEPAGVLSELLERAGKPGAGPYRETASTRYEELLLKVRAGFLDHASEFFAGPGKQPARGLKLAEENLALRDTARSRRLVLEAAAAAGSESQGCVVAATSQAWAKRSPSLQAALSKYSAGCSTAPK